jgi:peptidoglycan glycosyltransferase
VVQRFAPAVYGQAISPSAADQLTAMMINVVQHGTGQAAQIPGIAVAGKTGTAQHGIGAAPHAWFTAFASSGGRSIAVAVIVLDGGSLGSEATGGQIAAPIAKQVMQAYLEGKA